MSKHNLSHHWRTVLTKMSEFPSGIDKKTLCEILGDDDRRRMTNGVLNQMFFSDHEYYTNGPAGSNIIKITDEGLEAINET